jgi:adenylate cyclase
MKRAEQKVFVQQWFRQTALWAFFGTMGLLLILMQPVLQRLDIRMRDGWQQCRLAVQAAESGTFLGSFRSFFPVPKSPRDVVLVLADDRSVLGIPALYQGNRRVYARVIRNIAACHPRVIGLDVFFPSGSVHDPEQDVLLTEAVKDAGNVVLKAFRRGDRQMTPPFSALARVAVVAPSYFQPHIDEAVRKTSVVFRRGSGEAVLGFHAEMARRFRGVEDRGLEITDQALRMTWPGGEQIIPLADGEYAFVDYAFHPRDLLVLPMMDVYDGKVDPSVFKDRAVIIGTANSMSEDRHFTPLGGPEFTPFIHGLIVQAFLDRGCLTSGGRLEGPVWGFIILVGMVFLAGPWLTTTAMTVGALLLSGLLIAGSGFSLLHLQRMTDVMPALFALLGSWMFIIGVRYQVERSEKLRIKNAFQHYVTASVVNEILKDPDKLKLHGEERDLTIFFSDIEGFTTLSEGMSPFDVVSLLNEYLTHMTEIIFQYGGLLDKYEGDAIMSVFGAPVDQRDHAVRACMCALEHQRALAVLREKWRKDGKPEICVRIGINTGTVVVGNMGSRMRFDYTVIGDNVNLASRLETANKIFRTSILVSGATAEVVQDEILVRFMGMLRATGRRQVVPVYEVLARLDDPDKGMIEQQKRAKKVFEDALAHTLQRRFSEAITLLEEYLPGNSTDLPAIFLKKRCEAFLASPPPPDWDGVFHQDQK